MEKKKMEACLGYDGQGRTQEVIIYEVMGPEK